MARSAPQDIAVAFRSFPRRLTTALEASEDDTGVAAASPLVAQLDTVVRDAARTLGLPAAGALPDTAAAVADAVENRPADQWQDGQLDQLRAAALEGGRLLREVEAAVRR